MISLDRSRRMDFRYRDYVCFFPAGRNKSFTQRCIKNGANRTRKLCREITQYPVWEPIRTWRFVNVDLAQLTLDVMWTDREVTGQCIRWQWHVFVIQRAEISGDTLEEGVHAGSQSMHVTVMDLVGEATQRRITRLQTTESRTISKTAEIEC